MVIKIRSCSTFHYLSMGILDHYQKKSEKMSMTMLDIRARSETVLEIILIEN